MLTIHLRELEPRWTIIEKRKNRNNFNGNRYKVLPFFDLELFWDVRGRLEFQVHRKKDQLLKYPKKESTRTKAKFKAIPNRVLNRLEKIAPITEENAKTIIKERYPDHANALARAGLGTQKTFRP